MIEFGADDKRDRWGHSIKAAKRHKLYAYSFIRAEKIAIKASLEHKKWDVHIYDLYGPSEKYSPCSTWLVRSYKAGKCVEINEWYTRTITNIIYKSK